jgi:hypothetical protein
MKKQYYCSGCGSVSEHNHVHNCAHGTPETHMAGTERFTCRLCGHAVAAADKEASRFPFILDAVIHLPEVIE